MSSGDVHQRRITDVQGRITVLGLQSSNAKVIPPPTVAIALAGQGKTRGTVALTLIPLCTNQSVALAKGHEHLLDTTYLFHALDARYEELRARSAGGGRAGLSKAIIEQIPLPLPPLPEQRRIAEILDTADEAIQATKRLIEKLKAAKQGLLHDLLTRGLDAEGRLRDPVAHPEQFVDSPLGRVPREWDVMTLGEVCERNGGSVQTGPFGSQLHAADYKAEGTPIITVEHLGDGEILHANLPLVGERDLTRLSRYGLQKGDLVFSRVGAIDRCAIVTDREYGWLFSGRCLRVRPGLGWLSSLFLSYQLNSYDVRRWILNHSVGSTMPCLNTSILSAVPIRVPQTAERNSIAVILGAQDALIRAEEAHRDKLVQLKKGLMEDLLTGRVRVGKDPAAGGG